jgi:hypothetical protein
MPFKNMHGEIDADHKIIASYFPHRFDKIVNQVLVKVFFDIRGGTIKIFKQFLNSAHRNVNGEPSA